MSRINISTHELFTQPSVTSLYLTSGGLISRGTYNASRRLELKLKVVVRVSLLLHSTFQVKAQSLDG